jgi:hypothetical protein
LSKQVSFSCELPEEQAYALAELCKRIGFKDLREHAVDQEETYQMVYGLSALRDALAASGVVVR